MKKCYIEERSDRGCHKIKQHYSIASWKLSKTTSLAINNINVSHPEGLQILYVETEPSTSCLK